MQELDPRTGRTVLNRYNRGKYHRDTVLDGEIVLDVYQDGRQRLKFLVFDALVVDRKSLLQRNLSTRLGVPPLFELETDFSMQGSGFIRRTRLC